MPAGVVFVALHPPLLVDALRPLASRLRPEAVLISLAPKVTIAKPSETLSGFARVVRTIPNAGFNPVALSPNFTGAERDGLLGWLGKLGESFGLPADAAGVGLARMAAGAAKTFFELGLTPEEVMDLVPVKPLQEEEAGIRSAYQTRLGAIYRKLKG